MTWGNCEWAMLRAPGAHSNSKLQRPSRSVLAACSMSWWKPGTRGTELGDWGYMPTDPQTLSRELVRRGIVMLGAFVPVALKDASSHRAGQDAAVKTARLLAAVSRKPAPFLVLGGQERKRAAAHFERGRITPEMGLSAAEWKTFRGGRRLDRTSSSGCHRTGDCFSPPLCRLRRDSG